MATQDDLVAEVIELIEAADRTTHRHHVHQLALEWPSLAAVLAKLMQENGHRPPGIFRHALNNHG